MRILEVQTERAWAVLGEFSSWGSNQVHILTGPNGSGKTDVLTELASLQDDKRPGDRRGYVVWETGQEIVNTAQGYWKPHGPALTIAQTFSPFTRLPAPERPLLSLTSVYANGAPQDLRYVCIGLHKNSRILGGGLSKRILEQAIFRLSETPANASVISDVLRNLNFGDGFDLTYKPRKGLVRALAEFYKTGNVEVILSSILEGRSSYSTDGLGAELRRVNPDELRSLIGESLRLLREQNNAGNIFHLAFRSIGNKSSYDYAVLQALAFLRRLDILSLSSFELITRNQRMLDVTNASSGQQQMLCSIIGLATALKNDSLVLIDEPELSLHPRWQQVYLDYLRAALQPFENCHVLIATHSPLIAQRAQRLGLTIVQMGDRSEFKSSGSHRPSVEDTLMSVFDTPISDSMEFANQIFSIITDAESGDELARENGLVLLRKLQDFYSDPQLDDQQSLQLIRDAIDLLNIGE